MENEEVQKLVGKLAEYINWYGHACEYKDWNVEGNEIMKSYRRAQSKDIISGLAKEYPLYLRVKKKLPECIYDSLIFPTTLSEVGKFLTDKGLTDREKSAVSGTIARLGWENCLKEMLEYIEEVYIPLVKE